MRTINLKGITNSLSESEMKNVVGGFEVQMQAARELEDSGDGATPVCSGLCDGGIHLCWTQAGGDGRCKYKDGKCGCF